MTEKVEKESGGMRKGFKTLPPFVRFLAVGLSNTVIGFLAFRLSMLLLPVFSFKTALSQSICYVCGATWSFFWNRRLTFESDAPAGEQGVRFFLVQGFMLGVTSFYMWVAVDLMKGPENINWLVITGFATFLNYKLLKHFAFRRSRA